MVASVGCIRCQESMGVLLVPSACSFSTFLYLSRPLVETGKGTGGTGEGKEPKGQEKSQHDES